jgi:hypothetical protein
MAGSSMAPFRSLGVWAAWCVLCMLAASSRAEASSSDSAAAAALFDSGVQKFKQAEYVEAADAFLRADAAAPNTQALLNAITSGRRGHAHLLVARASERALARADADAELKRLAREALTEAAAHLARVELSCVPAAPKASCAITTDDAEGAAGAHYLLPGTHRFVGQTAGGGRDDQPLTCNAGATYTVVLRPSAGPSAPPSATAATTAPVAAKRGWPPVVVYAGAGVTAALVGLTVWSGVDTLDARKALPAVPARTQNEEVLGRAHRTSGLLAGSVLVGVVTAAVGVWLVVWDRPAGPAAALVAAPLADGAHVALRGRF